MKVSSQDSSGSVVKDAGVRYVWRSLVQTLVIFFDIFCAPFYLR